MKDLFPEYDGQPPKVHHQCGDHRDHYIEAQHHSEDYFKEHPRRRIEQFEAIEGSFPKQDVMLIDITSKIKRIMSIEFVYNSGKVCRDVMDGDMVRVFFIDNENNNVEIVGRISDIVYNMKTIIIDSSEFYQWKKYSIPISRLRFISTDLDETPPFLSKIEVKPHHHHCVKPEKPSYAKPIIK